MTLIRYNRPNGNNLMSKRFSDIMDDFFNDMVSTRQETFVPSIEVSESDTQFEINAELPGMKKEDIDISMENNRLTISGDRSFKKEEEEKTYHRVETQYGSFSRSMQLPDNIQEDSIEATYEDGVLRITINKSKDKVRKKIEIS